MRSLMSCLRLMIAAIGLLNGASLAAEFSFKVAHTNAPGEITARGVDHFKTRLEALSGGRATIANFNNGQLGAELPMIEGVLLGSDRHRRAGEWAFGNLYRCSACWTCDPVPRRGASRQSRERHGRRRAAGRGGQTRFPPSRDLQFRHSPHHDENCRGAHRGPEEQENPNHAEPGSHGSVSRVRSEFDPARVPRSTAPCRPVWSTALMPRTPTTARRSSTRWQATGRWSVG